jgi:hypothetical protein
MTERTVAATSPSTRSHAGPDRVVASGEPREKTPSPPPGARWLRAGIALLCGVASVVIATLQLFGGVGALLEPSGPPPLSSARLAYELQTRYPGGHATCAGELPPEVGATTTCTVLTGGREIAVRAIVVGVQGMNIDYDVRP